MASKSLHHGRSLSLPSTSHPAITHFDENLSKLKSSEGTSSSLSSMNNAMNGLRSLYESIDDLLLLPNVQQIISEECADDYIKLFYGFSTVKDLISVVKQDLRDLLSAMRRKDAHGITNYLASRRNSKKIIQKSLKNMRRCTSAKSERESENMALVSMLKDAESLTFSVLESFLAYTLGKKIQESKSGRSMVSKLMHSRKVTDEKNEFNKVNSFLQQSQDNELVNHLKQMDSSIQALDEELESIFRQLIKTRVSLLNILNH